MNLRIALVLALAAIAGCSQRRVTDDTWPVVRLGFQRVAPYQAFFVAEEKGFFRSERVRVEASELSNSNVLGQAQLAGQIDGSGFMSFPVLLAMEQNAPGQTSCQLVLPMTAESRFSAVVVPIASEITTPMELRGRRIGTYPSATNVIFATMMVERLFGSPDAARIQQIDPPNQFPLLLSGGVDALVGPDPMPATAVARGIGRVLVYSPDARFVMDPMPVGCATLARAFEDREPEAARRVRRALERAVGFMRDPGNLAEVRAIAARRTGIDADVVAQMGVVEYQLLAEADPRSVQQLSDLLEREKVLVRHVDASRLFGQR
jgi:ABC-type nitrate/sulfonate/bicarbonate transport system substrate-binding protein